MPSALSETLKDPVLSRDMFDHVRCLYHFCIAVTPVFALSPRSFEDTAVRRSCLISVSISLNSIFTFAAMGLQAAISFGNEKPLFLGLTEKALWRSLMRASTSGDTYTALNDFIGEFQDLQVRFRGPE